MILRASPRKVARRLSECSIAATSPAAALHPRSKGVRVAARMSSELLCRRPARGSFVINQSDYLSTIYVGMQLEDRFSARQQHYALRRGDWAGRVRRGRVATLVPPHRNISAPQDVAPTECYSCRGHYSPEYRRHPKRELPSHG